MRTVNTRSVQVLHRPFRITNMRSRRHDLSRFITVAVNRPSQYGGPVPVLFSPIDGLGAALTHTVCRLNVRLVAGTETCRMWAITNNRDCYWDMGKSGFPRFLRMCEKRCARNSHTHTHSSRKQSVTIWMYPSVMDLPFLIQ